MQSATTVSSVRSSNSKLLFRSVIAILALLLLVFLGFDFWFYRAARASLPQLNGSIHVRGLREPVDVTFDSIGVPNVYASNLADLFFAQGYITAQDRLWQMDTMRRFGSGDLSAVLGPKYVQVDREQRILGLRQVADNAAAGMDRAQKVYFQAYADGVNAYIQQHQKTLPLEFRFLTYFPHVWTVEDSLMVGLSMTEFLNHGLYKEKLEKEKLMAKLGPELTGDLYVNSSWRDHPPGSEAHSIENEVPPEIAPEEEEEAPGPGNKSRQAKPLRLQPSTRSDLLPWISPELEVPSRDQFRPGSNNWVVSGVHTATGKPLLSNDMHLELALPNVWYEVHLAAKVFDVAGVTLPGFPFVIAGHNRYVGWGFTNLGPNVEDLYVEQFNEKGEYLTPQGWVRPQHRQEIIEVKGRHELKVDVVTTRHGPIISDLVSGEKRQLALKWTIYDPQAMKIPFFAIDSATNWRDFRTALSQFGAPAQNVVYADIGGNIGYQATGMIPTRSAGDGSVPVSGSDDTQEWTGYIPFDQLPTVYDPPSGILATANGRITPDGYPSSLSIEWMAPYRTQRIYKLLKAGKALTTADMLAIQMDVVSEFDRFCAERFVYSVDHTPKASERAKAAADLMRKWDGKMATDSAAATIAFYSGEKLRELLLKPKLGDQWANYHWLMSSVWLENVLSKQPTRWLPTGYTSYDELLTAAVEAAVNDIRTPRLLATWRWGRVHRAEIKHPFWSNFPILKKGADPGPQPLSGNRETIKQTGPHFGPSERMTVDFSNLDESTLNLVNGQSGGVFADHYNDQWDAYYHGRTFAQPFSTHAVQQAGTQRLKLLPQ